MHISNLWVSKSLSNSQLRPVERYMKAEIDCGCFSFAPPMCARDSLIGLQAQRCEPWDNGVPLPYKNWSKGYETLTKNCKKI